MGKNIISRGFVERVFPPPHTRSHVGNSTALPPPLPTGPFHPSTPPPWDGGPGRGLARGGGAAALGGRAAGLGRGPGGAVRRGPRWGAGPPGPRGPCRAAPPVRRRVDGPAPRSVHTWHTIRNFCSSAFWLWQTPPLEFACPGGKPTSGAVRPGASVNETARASFRDQTQPQPSAWFSASVDRRNPTPQRTWFLRSSHQRKPSGARGAGGGRGGVTPYHPHPIFQQTLTGVCVVGKKEGRLSPGRGRCTVPSSVPAAGRRGTRTRAAGLLSAAGGRRAAGLREQR